MTCQATRQLDQMRCVPCRLAWDYDDPEPPPCNHGQEELRVTPPAAEEPAPFADPEEPEFSCILCRDTYDCPMCDGEGCDLCYDTGDCPECNV